MKKFKTMSEIDLLYYAYWNLLDELERVRDKIKAFPTGCHYASYSVKLQERLDEINAEIIRLERKEGK